MSWPQPAHPANGHEAAHTAPEPAGHFDTLPHDRLERVEAWGLNSASMAHVYRPSTVGRLREVFELARRTGRQIAFRGGGRSYGDAFQNSEQIVLDLSRMNRVLDWDPDEGVISLEPGVTIEQLWQYMLEDGWWPAVVPGTMFTTMGGCVGMNIHGKNAWKVGPFGDHVLDFDFLLPSGEIVRVDRKSDPDLFRGAIGGFGMLGCFTRVRLAAKRVHSGLLRVFPQRVRNFDEMIDSFEENAGRMDYMVGWADCFAARARSLGRGEMHFAQYLEPGEDPFPAQTLRVENQKLPDTIMAFLPKSIVWRLAAPFVNNLGMRLVNTLKYHAQLRPGAGKPYLQSHAAFAFLLDYVPNWHHAYKPGGLIQYQSFVPKEYAADVFAEQVRLSHRFGIVPYLAVTKKHVPDDFLITHAVDGYSMALDYPVTVANRKRLWGLCHEMDEMILAAGGRFYLAKDATMRPGTPRRYLPERNLERFTALKQRCDPEGMLSSNLYRRVFGAEGPKTGGKAGMKSASLRVAGRSA